MTAAKPRKGSVADVCQRVALVVNPIMLLARDAVAADLTYDQVATLLKAAMEREVREGGSRASKA